MQRIQLWIVWNLSYNVFKINSAHFARQNVSICLMLHSQQNAIAIRYMKESDWWNSNPNDPIGIEGLHLLTLHFFFCRRWRVFAGQFTVPREFRLRQHSRVILLPVQGRVLEQQDGQSVRFLVRRCRRVQTAMGRHLRPYLPLVFCVSEHGRGLHVWLQQLHKLHHRWRLLTCTIIIIIIIWSCDTVTMTHPTVIQTQKCEPCQLNTNHTLSCRELSTWHSLIGWPQFNRHAWTTTDEYNELLN